MRVFAFDVDGTLDCSEGPVPVADLHAIENSDVVVIVSPSMHGPEGFPKALGEDRLESLLLVRKSYPDADHYIYISDNPGDDAVAEQAGFEYIHPFDWEV